GERRDVVWFVPGTPGEDSHRAIARLVEGREAVRRVMLSVALIAARRRAMERVFPHRVPARFPHVRPLNDAWRLMALDASVPRLFSSRGRVDPTQQREAETIVRSLSPQQGLVVLCHYPVAVPDSVRSPWEHRLANAPALLDLIAATRAPVIWMHGHVHMPWHWQPSASHLSHLTSINAGSPTLRDGPQRRGHGFWQIDLPGEIGGQITFVRHEPVSDDPADQGWIMHPVP
ncbi:MAG: hypothetical protein QGG89_17625, partial [Vicinamibacterales bacterium]|nr:hypothetical protein [Vicinamibacterales bacterium]